MVTTEVPRRGLSGRGVLGPLPGGGRKPRGRSLEPYVYLAPLLLALGGLIAYPLLLNGYLSTVTARNVTTEDRPFVGTENYERVLTDDRFWNSFQASMVITVATVLLSFLGGLALALALNKIGRGRAVIFVVVLLPWVLSPVVSGYAWRWLFNDQFGFVNHFLMSLGLIDENINWLADPDTAVIAVIVASTWRLAPYMTLMLVASLQAVPRDMYEAAGVDGAGPFRQFWHVTIPQLRYVIGVVVLFGFIWTFNDFAIPYVMTGGGPAGATNVLPILVYETAFRSLQFGTAAAVSVIVLLILLVVSIPYAVRLASGAVEEK